jgi:molecular chaperone GrpE
VQSHPPEANPVEQKLAAVLEEVSQLRDLFQRRLLEDKAKARLYDDLHDQLVLARGGLTEQLLAPLFRELLLLLDRIDIASDGGDDVLASVVDELHEIMSRRDVVRLDVLDRFNPAVHEAVRTESHPGLEPGKIVAVLRPGYRIGNQLLRAERVVVAAQEQSASPATVTASGETVDPTDAPEVDLERQ